MWRADLDGVGQSLAGLLNAHERARAQRIVREPARSRWVAARGVLRALLGNYLDEDPRTLRLATHEYGKPTLDSCGRAHLHFNLSHSGPLGVYALSATDPVGVDAEMIQRRTPGESAATRRERDVALARRVFGEAMAEGLQALGPHARQRELLRAWVRYEAERKRVGIGIWGARTHTTDLNHEAAWTADLDLGSDAVGAVALSCGPLELSLKDWPINVDCQDSVHQFPACGSILP